MSRPIEIEEATIDDLAWSMTQGAWTSEGLVERYRERIEAIDVRLLHSILCMNPDAAADGRLLDQERAAGHVRGPLHGIPILIKDNFDIRGLPTTAGSVTLEGLIPLRDAVVVERLREAGAVILGKTNLHEFAAGITTVSSAGGATRNPYDPSRNPGGSSGGTAAAVAASLAAAGMGSDTTGSIRVAAAQTNLVGLRPTKGLTSLSGIVPLSRTQDVVGPLARTISDLAHMLDSIGCMTLGRSESRSTSGSSITFSAVLGDVSLEGLRLGRLETLFGDEEADAESAAVVDGALVELGNAGVEIVPVALPKLTGLLDLSFQVVMGEFADDLAIYLARHPSAGHSSLSSIVSTGRLHPEVAPVLEVLAANHSKTREGYQLALARREPLRKMLIECLERLEIAALVYPTITRVAAPIGEPQAGNNAHASANSGLPALSIPAGFTDGGLPVGMDLLGLPFSDRTLVAVGHAIEQSHCRRRPPATGSVS